MKGALANVGKNYWTFERGAAASYLSSKYGFELTAFTGFDFNTENGTTNYQTGDQFYLDGTLAQHLPLLAESSAPARTDFSISKSVATVAAARSWVASKA